MTIIIKIHHIFSNHSFIKLYKLNIVFYLFLLKSYEAPNLNTKYYSLTILKCLKLNF